MDEKYNAYIVLLDLDCYGISLDLAFPRLALESWLMQEPKIESESLVREPSLEGSKCFINVIMEENEIFFLDVCMNRFWPSRTFFKEEII